MPFRLGKGDKKNEEPDEEPAVADQEAEDPLDAEPPEAAEQDPAQADTPDEDEASPDEPEQAAAQTFSRPEFRPSFPNGGAEAAQRSAGKNDPDASRGHASGNGSPASPPSEQLIFVVIRDEQGQTVSLQQFDEARDARAHVELSVESGTPEEHVAVFRASRVPVQVVRRPVVRLIPKED